MVSTPFPDAQVSPVVLRVTTDSDVERLTQLNNDAYPAVPRVTQSDMTELLDQANWSRVLDRDGDILAVVICFSPGQDYDSENYRYFESHFQDHFYIDRIVVDQAHRGEGLGAKAYAAVFDQARSQGLSHVTCEVNLEPPNPASIAFHRSMGFVDVDTQATKGGSVIVQLMAATLDDG